MPMTPVKRSADGVEVTWWGGWPHQVTIETSRGELKLCGREQVEGLRYVLGHILEAIQADDARHQ